MKVNLKRIINQREVSKFLNDFADLLGEAVSIYDPRGKCIFGPAENDGLEHPVVLEDTYLGLVRGGNDSSVVSSLLYSLAALERNKKTVVQEALDKYREISLLYEMAEKITVLVDPGKIGDMIIEGLLRLVVVDHVSIMMLDKGADRLKVLASHGPGPKPGDEIAADSGLFLDILEKARSEIINDFAADPREINGFHDSREITGFSGISSLICAPLRVNEENLGLFLVASHTPKTFTSGDLSLVSALAYQGAVSLENVRLLKKLEAYSFSLEQQVADRTAALKQANRELELLATIDPLTRINNRRRFDETLTSEWARLRREQAPLSLIMCDVDFFKLFNDTYGHQAGDRCLRAVAEALESSVMRPADLPARYGGEEFAVILPNTPPEGAVRVAEMIRDRICELRIKHDRSSVSPYVSISAGVSSLVPGPDVSPETLLARADEALYQAKENGRNRVVLKP